MTATDSPATIRRWRSFVTLYRATARSAMLHAFQYRAGIIVMVTALLSEPIVYLIVWRTVARESGGSVEGYTEARFAAYYIVWTFVRQITQFNSPQDWEHLIRSGDLNRWLLRPMNPIHDHLGGAPAVGLVVATYCVPIGLTLTIFFRPDIDTSPIQVIAFVVACLLAVTINVLINAIVGSTAFWLTKIQAVANLQWTLMLLLSGRLVPVDLLPDWARTVSSVLWFRWVLDFPITTMIGPAPGRDVVVGLAMQVLWIAIAAVGARWMWRRGVRRYGAVGG